MFAALKAIEGCNTVEFFASGVPRPGGSKSPFLHPHTKRIVIPDASKYAQPWRCSVADAAISAMGETEPFDGAVLLCITFVFPRPQSHYNSKGVLKASAPIYHTVAPDVTKLLRSTEDALKGITWRDDSRVARQEAEKVYIHANPKYRTPGAFICITHLGKPTIPK